MDIVIGTAGHIDHGKTTLVKALTGVDTDRWAEEKARGITIDLGFASCHNDQHTLAFVDVPGHKHFVHNMLAGMTGIDAVLLVVAADEGIMPQTREHFAICQLLGITHGVIALTRTDIADDELTAISYEDIQQLSKGTFLAEAPIFPVSAHTGEGIEPLKKALFSLAQPAHKHSPQNPFRLPVDRSFSMKGFGTVITGTVVEGSLHKDQSITQFPSKKPLRVRGMQVQGKLVEQVHVGQRAAINLSGVDKHQIERGHQLAAPHSLLCTERLDIKVSWLPDAAAPYQQQGKPKRLRVHLGTQAVLGKLQWLDRHAANPCFARLQLEQPLCTRYGDRVILRSYSPIHTIGGGVVLDPVPLAARRIPATTAVQLQQLDDTDPAHFIETLLMLRGMEGLVQSERYARSGLGEKQWQAILPTLGSGIILDPLAGRLLHLRSVTTLEAQLLTLIEHHHQQYPQQIGISAAELNGKMPSSLSSKEVTALLTRLHAAKKVSEHAGRYHLPHYQPQQDPVQQQQLTRCIELIAAGGYQPLRTKLLFETLAVSASTGQDLLQRAVTNQHLLSIKPDLYYTPEIISEITLLAKKLNEDEGEITVSSFKKVAGLNRKYAVDLLEYFDACKLTMRVGESRVLRGK